MSTKSIIDVPLVPLSEKISELIEWSTGCDIKELKFSFTIGRTAFERVTSIGVQLKEMQRDRKKEREVFLIRQNRVQLGYRL